MTTHKFQGRVIDRVTKAGLPNLRVEGWDVRNVVRDMVCATDTGAGGAFTLEVDDADLDDLFNKARPVLFFRVLDDDKVLAATDRTVRWFARGDAKADLEVDTARIVGKATPTLADYVVDVVLVDPATGPLSGKDVDVYDVDLSASATTETVLASGITDTRGHVRVVYAPTVGGVRRAQPRLKVRAEERGTNTLIAETFVCRAKPRERVTLVIGGGTYAGTPRYTSTLDRVTAVLGPANLANLTAAQIDVLACRGNIPRDEVDEIASAAKMNAAVAGVSAEAFYGIIRGGLPRNLADLATRRLPHIRRTLEESIARNDVSSALSGSLTTTMQSLETALVAQQFIERTDGVPAGVIAARTASTDTNQREAFVKIAMNHEGDAKSFWEAVDTALTSEVAARFRVTAEAAPLVASHPPMVAELSSRYNAGALENYRALAQYDRQAWLDIINLPGVGVPATTPPTTPAAYADSIVARVEARFRTRTAAWRIKQASGTDPMNGFFFNGNLERNATFDFAAYRVEHYLRENPTALSGVAGPEQAGVVARLKEMERVYKITDNFAQMNVLLASGSAPKNSASTFHEMGLTNFKATYGAALGSGAAGMATAESIFEKACWVTAQSVIKWWQFSPKANPPSEKANVLTNHYSPAVVLPNSIADWKDLFGSLDSCACKHCQSVYGPASYLVELLRFLKKQKLVSPSTETGQDKLFDLRPDIELMALDCANADTPLAYIDLVNEVMEVKAAKLISPPGPAMPAGPIETTYDPDELLGAPEVKYPESFKLVYRYFAGETVSGSVVAYPPKAVLHLWDEESRVLLEHLGVPRHELLRVLEPVSPHTDHPQWIAAERLGISRRAYRLIAGLDATILQLWGGTALSSLDEMPTFLKKSRLSFIEALELFEADVLVATPPPPAAIAVVRDGDEPCNTDLMTIENLTDVRLDLISRMLRLRTALGWTIHEVDQAIFTAGGSALDDTFLQKLARIEDVRARLRLAPLEAAALYGNVSISERLHNGVSEPSLFGKVFLKKTVADPDTAVFSEIDEYGTPTGGPALNSHQPAILAALNLTSADYRLLVAPFDPPQPVDADTSHPLKVRWPVVVDTLFLTLPSLSRLYRIATFTQAARLSVRDHLILRAYSGKNVLDGDELVSGTPQPGVPDEAVDYLDVVDNVRALRIDIAELDFYLRDFSSEPSSLRPSEEEVTFWHDEIMGGVAQAMKAAEAVTDDDVGTLSKKLLLAFFTEGSIPYTSILSYVDSGGDPSRIADLAPYVRDLDDAEDKLDAGGPLTERRDRYAYLAQQLSRYLDSFNFVVQALAIRFSIDAEAMKHLVTVSIKRISSPTQASIREFLPDLHPANTATPPAVPDPFEGTATDRKKLLRRIHKAAGIVRQLGLTTREVTQLFPESGASAALPFLALNELPVLDTGPSNLLDADSNARSRFTAWLRIARIVELRNSWKAGSENLFAIFTAAATETLEKLQFFTSEGSGWPLADVEHLCSWFGLDAESFKDELGLLKLDKAMRALLRMGVAAKEATRWTDLSRAVPADPLNVPAVESTTDPNPVWVARSIRRIARSRNGTAGWRDVIRPLRDRLREKQRDALVELVLHKTNRNESRELFGDMLIDVDMSPVMLTSRIVQAHGTIQTFVQRSMLRYYDDFELNEDAGNQWRWMKNYRVWEANRKIFLYPENWIEPDLRDDKSPLYQAFERQMRQGPVTLAAAESAYRAYLEGLEELSNLDVRAVCVEEKPTNAPTLNAAKEYAYHVFARTRAPHRYYYRRHEDGAWTSWEKLDIDIEGDHLMPIFYQGSLYLFWPTFTEVEHPDNASRDEAPPYLNTRLGVRYAERRHRQWTASQSIGISVDLGGTPPHEALSFQVFEFSSGLRIEGLGYSTAAVPPGNTSKPDHIVTFDFDPLRPAQGRLSGINFLVPSSSVQLSPQTFVTEDVGRPWETYLEAQHFIRLDSSPYSKLYLHILDADWHEILQDVPRGFRIVVPRTQETTYERPIVFLQDRERSFVGRLLTYRKHEGSGTGLSLFDTPDVNYQLAFSSFGKGYWFERFDHGYIYEFRKALAARGLDGLLRRASQDEPKLQDLGGSVDFSPSYGPTSLVQKFPVDEVDFAHGSPMGVYNWELFFHLPFAIAQSLSREGRYEDAIKWFHYVFDPTDGGAATGQANSYWKFKPFYENLDLASIQQQLTSVSQNTYVQEMDAWANAQESNTVNAKVIAQINLWRKNPFNPHALARLRPVAYQKAVVLAYIDNLIAWGDQLFTRDTMESVNEATQLYLMAWDILGPRPNIVPTDPPAPKTYQDLQAIDPFGNAFIENVEAVQDAGGILEVCHDTPPPPLIGSPYFCIPPNDILLGKWDVIEDRLFKIRHGQNIEGIERQLPLFSPPIDPALLVQAAAFGIDFQTVLNDVAAGAPAYRFTVLQQKAVEFASFVSSLGAQLLSAIEKKDAEHLAMLRADQEIEVQDAILDTKKQQLAAAKQDLAAAKESKKLAESRRDFYEDAQGNSPLEDAALVTSAIAQGVKLTSEVVRLTASGSHPAPNTAHGGAGAMGSPLEVIIVGGPGIGASNDSAAEAIGVIADTISWAAGTMATQAGYQRRDEEFELQEDLAKKEIRQIEKQIAAAELRVAVAEHELALTDKQLTQARDVRRVMLEKFTKEDLYDWMQAEAGAVYYQAYKLAYDLAKKAERAFQIERGDTSQTYIRFNNWDGIKRGLLAGEKLALDLRKLDAAYHEQNKRELELTKHVSLAKHDPEALLGLRETGVAAFRIGENEFTRDYPKHYLRRLKQVSVSLPCVAGAYEGVSSTLSLNAGETRLSPTANPTTLFHNIQSICTSTAREDGGIFELGFRDERLLPFEGAGAHYDGSGAQWRFELSAGNELVGDSIDDLVLHIRYTARSGRNASATATNRKRLFRLKHDFADTWSSYTEGTATEVVLPWTASMFPSGWKEQADKVQAFRVYTRGISTTNVQLVLTRDGGGGPPSNTSGGAWSAPTGGSTSLSQWVAAVPTTTMVSGTWRLSFTNVPPSPPAPKPADVWIVVEYSTAAIP